MARKTKKTGIVRLNKGVKWIKNKMVLGTKIPVA